MKGFIIVLDSFGIGYAPDAALFGDEGANTLATISKSPYFKADNLERLGLFAIDGIDISSQAVPYGVYARLRELSAGKDTTIGHWEMAGVVSSSPLPVFPGGFPPEIINRFEKEIGRKTLVNKPYSGTQVIMDYGEEHLRTGKPIIYTSADSVFQIAAHESIIDNETLYSYCRTARRILCGKYGVGRVIARPFRGTDHTNFVRTAARHDFSIEPPDRTLLDALQENGIHTVSVGKIYDIFAHRGINEHYFTSCNAEGIKKTVEIANSDFNGFCYTNLVDCDMLYGHRRDIDGYARAISEFDNALPDILGGLNNDDFIIITADHGCDPGFSGTDHTREYVPYLLYSKNIFPRNLHTVDGFGLCANTVLSLFGIHERLQGEEI